MLYDLGGRIACCLPSLNVNSVSVRTSSDGVLRVASSYTTGVAFIRYNVLIVSIVNELRPE
ncbi:hypothetical protein D3C83_296210 [compost metagenome]